MRIHRPRAFLRLLAGIALALGLGSAAAAPLNDHAALSGLSSAKAVFLIDVNNPGRVGHVLRCRHDGEGTEGTTRHSASGSRFRRPRRSLPYPRSSRHKLHGPACRGRHPTRNRTTAQAGVTIQACGIAMKGMDVTPDMLIPGVQAVGNGYISVIGYQAKGYSLVPVY